VLGAQPYPLNALMRGMPERVRISGAAQAIARNQSHHGWVDGRDESWPPILPDLGTGVRPHEAVEVATPADPDLDSLLYLFACKVEWEKNSETGAAWEIIAAARGAHEGARAHALSLLEHFERMDRDASKVNSSTQQYRRNSVSEAGMRTPYGLEGFFCRFSTPVSRATDMVSHHTVMPAGAVLFIEGQTPRGAFVLCSGKVKLSTTSKEGKVLILKQAEAGDVLGLSAAISGTNYEMTAETATACQLNFIGRTDLMKLLQSESEVGMHTALWLSREFQGAYRDIHDLVLARSSSGKLARLLLSCAPPAVKESEEQRLRSAMTHEEMAQRIGSSRETVTRLLSDLKKKRLIRLDGATLIIRDRPGLEALAV
jgi:CRP/FNR family transcriptional regulator, cyclic AMP receptor protein